MTLLHFLTVSNLVASNQQLEATLIGVADIGDTKASFALFCQLHVDHKSCFRKLAQTKIDTWACGLSSLTWRQGLIGATGALSGRRVESGTARR